MNTKNFYELTLLKNIGVTHIKKYLQKYIQNPIQQNVNIEICEEINEDSEENPHKYIPYNPEKKKQILK